MDKFLTKIKYQLFAIFGLITLGLVTYYMGIGIEGFYFVVAIKAYLQLSEIDERIPR